MLSDVFERDGNSTISQRTFFSLIAIFVGAGLLVNFLLTSYLISIGFSMTWVGALICFVVAIVGIFIATNDSPVVGVTGYALIVGSLSFLLTGMLSTKTSTVINNALLMTLLTTGIMGVAGVTFPDFFSKLGPVLFIALCSLLIIRIVGIFWPAFGAMSLWDYLAAAIFSLYIGFDMWRASTIERSVRNALDVSISLYLDIVNLFTSFLALIDND